METENAMFMRRTAAQVMNGLPLKNVKYMIGDITGHVLKFLKAIAATPERSHVTPIGCLLIVSTFWLETLRRSNASLLISSTINKL